MGMNTPDDFSQYHAELLEGVYDCVDRIVLNAFFPMGQTGGGMRCLWRQALAPGHAFDPLVAVQGSAAHRRGDSRTCGSSHDPIRDP